tara:strand:+ start:942 stop:1631 length:690 start_codon:yes stop_codon:yes gene_type:complete
MRILVVEDHRDIAENIADYFEPKGHALDFAVDGIGGLHLALTQDYDVIILDLMLPLMDGLEVCRKLRENGKNTTPVLMLTARDRIANKIEGFQAGADDYLLKPFAMAELEVRLQALHRRASGRLNSTVLRIADLEFDPDTLIAKRSSQALKLNPTTRALLRVLMENSHRVVPRAELEQVLWGEDPPEGDVLRAHIHTLRSVVDKPYPLKLIQTIHGAGYRIACDDHSDE